MTEDFEGAFPGSKWVLQGDPTWDDVNYWPRVHTGDYSGYCAGSSINPPGPYANNMSAWMIYGPFDLYDATDAELLFYRWQAADPDDFLAIQASIDGVHFYGTPRFGNSGGWVADSFDLTQMPIVGDLCGYQRVWIAFTFISNEDVADEGVYLDDIVLQKETGALPALPHTFDWRSQVASIPVRDQGDCGSCWAFSTVGALEYNIAIKDGTTTDLSEQYLVSCNMEGWNCHDGGKFVHDYHQWKYPPGETQAGAVLESAYPYVARDDPCTGSPHEHPYRIWSWAYVNTAALPAVWAIKQAIFEYGPVCSPVHVGDAFQDYEGGVFETNEWAGGDINHAILLMGWDDNQGTNGVWFLRNSWGGDWGESGDMRIGYGISAVGVFANYIQYPCPLPSTPSDPSPADHATDVPIDADLDWADGTDTSTYHVYFGTSSPPPYLGTTPSSSYSLPDLGYRTPYYWSVVAENGCLKQTTGPVWSFTTCTPAATPDGPSPADDATDVSINVDLDWADAALASSYDVYFGTSSPPPYYGRVRSSFYDLPTLKCSTHYYWKVVAQNNCGATAGPKWDFTTVANSPPAVGMVTPSSGRAKIGVMKYFTTTCSDPNGYADLKWCYFLIGTSTAPSNTVYLGYNQTTNKLYLCNNNGTAWWGGYAPGSANIIQNAQGKLDCSETKVWKTGNQVKVRWAVTFKSGYIGPKNLYLKAVDMSRATSGWEKKGTVTIGP